MSRERKGVVEVRHADGEEWTEQQLWNKDVDINLLLPRTGNAPPELSASRRDFDNMRNMLEPERGNGIAPLKLNDMYEKIRPLLPDNVKDLVCPKPPNYEEGSRAQLARDYQKQKLDKMS